MRLVTATVGAGLAAVGLVVLVAGTFLPWLRSGSALRNSYQSIGALRGLLSDDTGVSTALNGWLLVIPLCTVCVALYALRLRRVSAWLVCLVCALTGAAAGLAVLQAGGSGMIGVASVGPAVTVAGAAGGLAGGIIVLVGLRGHERDNLRRQP